MLMVVLRVRARSSGRLFVSEESAHAAALGRPSRNKHEESNCATVLALGDEEGQSPCHVVSLSRSKIQIVSSRPVRADAQLQVQRGDECFVGTVQQVVAREDGYLLKLDVFASNYRPPSPVALVLQAVTRGLLSVLHQFAVRVLGAELRPRQH
jgi:hypothetical protein